MCIYCRIAAQTQLNSPLSKVLPNNTFSGSSSFHRVQAQKNTHCFDRHQRKQHKHISCQKEWINFYTPLQLLVAKVCMHLVESVFDPAEGRVSLSNLQQKFIFRQIEDWFKHAEGKLKYAPLQCSMQVSQLSLSAHSWLWKYLNLVIKQFMRSKKIWSRKRVKCNP